MDENNALPHYFSMVWTQKKKRKERNPPFPSNFNSSDIPLSNINHFNNYNLPNLAISFYIFLQHHLSQVISSRTKGQYHQELALPPPNPQSFISSNISFIWHSGIHYSFTFSQRLQGRIHKSLCPSPIFLMLKQNGATEKTFNRLHTQ